MSRPHPLPKNDSPYGRRLGVFFGPGPRSAPTVGFWIPTHRSRFLRKCIFLGAQPDWRCRPARNSFYAELLIGVFLPSSARPDGAPPNLVPRFRMSRWARPLSHAPYAVARGRDSASAARRDILTHWESVSGPPPKHPPTSRAMRNNYMMRR